MRRLWRGNSGAIAVALSPRAAARLRRRTRRTRRSTPTARRPHEPFWALKMRPVPYVPGNSPSSTISSNSTPTNTLRPLAGRYSNHRAATGDGLRLPDPNADALKARSLRHHGVRPEQIFVGNGSGRGARTPFMALARTRAPRCGWTSPTTRFYPVMIAGLYDRRAAHRCRWPEDFSIRVETCARQRRAPARSSRSPTPTRPTARAPEVRARRHPQPTRCALVDRRLNRAWTSAATARSRAEYTAIPTCWSHAPSPEPLARRPARGLRGGDARRWSGLERIRTASLLPARPPRRRRRGGLGRGTGLLHASAAPGGRDAT